METLTREEARLAVRIVEGDRAIREALDNRHWEGGGETRQHKCTCETCQATKVVASLARERVDQLRSELKRLQREKHSGKTTSTTHPAPGD